MSDFDLSELIQRSLYEKVRGFPANAIIRVFEQIGLSHHTQACFIYMDYDQSRCEDTCSP